MTEWKKVIVSGSSAELNHITSSGHIKGNRWYGNLPEADNQEKIVTYDPTTGVFGWRELSNFPGGGG